MAITLVSAPEDHQPVYNPIEWIFSSDNSSKCDFVYIVDLYVNGNFAVRLKEFPNSPMGQGKFKVDRVLQDYLSHDFNPEVTVFTKNPKSICDYQLKVRERFNTLADCTGNPTLTSVLYTSAKKYGWNGALQYEEQPGYSEGNYDLEGIDSHFLSTVPLGIKFEADDFFTLKIIQSQGTSKELYVETFDFTGTLINSYTKSNPFYGSGVTQEQLLTVPVGPKNIQSFVTLSGVNFYTVVIRDNSGNVLSEKKLFYLKTRCTKFRRYRFWWLNRLGGFDAFSFDLKSVRTLNITKGSFTKLLKTDYSIGDRGETVTSVDAKNVYTVNSDWISEDEAIWLEELFTSPDVFVYESKQKTYRAKITGAAHTGSTASLFIDDSLLGRIPSGTTFSYYGTGFTAIGSPNSGINQITGYNVGGGYYTTDIVSSINAGAIIEGALKYDIETITKIPIIISNQAYEEKLKVNVKNIQYTMEFRPSFKKNIQGS